MEHLGIRFKKIREVLNINQQELADSLGLSKQAVSSVERGKNVISESTMRKLSLIYDINLNYLIMGNGEMFNIDIVEEQEKIPILGDIERIVSTNYNLEQESPKDLFNIPKTLINQIQANIKTSYILIFKGCSMAPAIEDEDKVLVDSSKQQVFNDKIYVIRIEDTLMIKRLQKLPKGALKIISDNKNHDSYILNPEKDNYKVLGQALWLGRCIS